jgi:hypothetical protein
MSFRKPSLVENSRRAALFIFVEFDDEVFRLCPAAQLVSGMALLCFAGGSFKAA